MTNKSPFPEAFHQASPLPVAKDGIFHATEFILKRNLDKHLFPDKMPKEQKIRSSEILKDALLSCRQLLHPNYFSATDLTPVQREFLQEHFLFLQNFQHSEDGQGCVLDDRGNFTAILHSEDHLQLALIDPSNKPEAALNHLLSIEDSLAHFFPFAFDKHFGYLTSDPRLAGTGLKIRSFIHVPALIHSDALPAAIDEIAEDALVFGLGSQKEFIGDVAVVENKYSTGLNEETIMHALLQATTALISKEKLERERIKKEPPTQILDKVARAHGLLSNMYAVKTVEAMQAMSLVQLGGTLDWIQPIDPMFFQDLFFTSRRAHILLSHPEATELETLRAQIIKKRYEGAKLAA